MSRMYRIAVNEAISRIVRTSDSIGTTLEILPVLEPRRMSGILEGELQRRGFKKGADGKMTREDNGIEIEIDPVERSVTVRAATEKQIDLEATRSTGVYDDVNDRTEREESLRQELKKELSRDLEKQCKQASKALQQQVTEKLEQSLRDIRKELDGISTKVTADALKQRAAEIGTIEELVEDGSGAMTIKVRL